MSDYIVMEPDETPYYSNDYSCMQKQRYKEVISQLNTVWNETIDQINFIHIFSTDDSNNIMEKLYRLFFIVYNYMTDYYSEENINMRRYNNYKYNKLLKIKTSKYIM